jgi:membrane-associated phospholipid phosphatase
MPFSNFTRSCSSGVPVLLLLFSSICSGQGNLDSPAVASGNSQTASPSCCSDIGRTVSLRKLPANLFADQKDIWLFPIKVAHGKHIWPTVGILGITAAFVATDAHSAPPFRNTTDFSGFNRVLSGANTAAFMAAVPAAMYGIGWWRQDSYAKGTALLAGEAVADGFILDIPLKAVTARRQPISYFGDGPYTDSFFNGTHNPFHSGGLYSGHAMAAMSIATVIARRYRSHRWVPFVAYGLAGAICFSRITRSDHFPGDVVLGGTMGFVLARYVVLPQRE